jgi:hypothetical protein
VPASTQPVVSNAIYFRPYLTHCLIYLTLPPDLSAFIIYIIINQLTGKGVEYDESDREVQSYCQSTLNTPAALNSLHELVTMQKYEHYLCQQREAATAAGAGAGAGAGSGNGSGSFIVGFDDDNISTMSASMRDFLSQWDPETISDQDFEALLAFVRSGLESKGIFAPIPPATHPAYTYQHSGVPHGGPYYRSPAAATATATAGLNMNAKRGKGQARGAVDISKVHHTNYRSSENIEAAHSDSPSVLGNKAPRVVATRQPDKPVAAPYMQGFGDSCENSMSSLSMSSSDSGRWHYRTKSGDGTLGRSMEEDQLRQLTMSMSGLAASAFKQNLANCDISRMGSAAAGAKITPNRKPTESFVQNNIDDPELEGMGNAHVHVEVGVGVAVRVAHSESGRASGSYSIERLGAAPPVEKTVLMHFQSDVSNTPINMDEGSAEGEQEAHTGGPVSGGAKNGTQDTIVGAEKYSGVGCAIPASGTSALAMSVVPVVNRATPMLPLFDEARHETHAKPVKVKKHRVAANAPGVDSPLDATLFRVAKSSESVSGKGFCHSSSSSAFDDCSVGSSASTRSGSVSIRSVNSMLSPITRYIAAGQGAGQGNPNAKHARAQLQKPAGHVGSK